MCSQGAKRRISFSIGVSELHINRRSALPVKLAAVKINAARIPARCKVATEFKGLLFRPLCRHSDSDSFESLWNEEFFSGHWHVRYLRWWPYRRWRKCQPKLR